MLKYQLILAVKKYLHYKPNAFEQAKFEYSPLGRTLNEGLDKSYKNKGI